MMRTTEPVRTASAAEKTLYVVALLLLPFNIISGVFYSQLQVALGHDLSNGAIPGPWLIVPLLSLLVLPAAAVLGFIVYLAGANKEGRYLVRAWAIGFVVCSALFHVLVFTSILAEDEFWGAADLVVL